jgi:hypothetical protein
MMLYCGELNPNVQFERGSSNFKRSESKELFELVADIIWKIVS